MLQRCEIYATISVTNNTKSVAKRKEFVVMDNIIVELPTITFFHYDLLMRALQYYRNSSCEFYSGTDYITELFILITRLQEKSEFVEK